MKYNLLYLVILIPYDINIIAFLLIILIIIIKHINITKVNDSSSGCQNHSVIIPSLLFKMQSALETSRSQVTFCSGKNKNFVYLPEKNLFTWSILRKIICPSSQNIKRLKDITPILAIRS